MQKNINIKKLKLWIKRIEHINAVYLLRRYPERNYPYNTNPESPDGLGPGNPDDPPVARQVS